MCSENVASMSAMCSENVASMSAMCSENIASMSAMLQGGDVPRAIASIQASDADQVDNGRLAYSLTVVDPPGEFFSTNYEASNLHAATNIFETFYVHSIYKL